jgi:predicted permease
VTTLAPWRSFARALLRRAEMEHDMDAELQSHVEARADHLVATGLDRAAALRQARLELGDPLRWKEQGREARGLRLVDQVQTDVRYGARWLRRSPAFATAAVCSIAIGIGINTAIFSLVDAVLLTRMPAEHPESLVLLSRSDDKNEAGSSFSYPFFRELQMARTLQSAIGRASFEPNVEAGDAAERVSGEMVSGNYFQALGVRPYLGRLFTADDDRIPGGHPVTVLGYGFWQRRFGGNPHIVGQTIRVNAHPMTIVGVTPREFTGVEIGTAADIRVPLVMQAEMLGSPSRLENPGEWWVQVIGRLVSRDGRELVPSLIATQQELDALFQRSLAEISSEASPERHLLLRDGSRGQLSLQNRFAKPLVVLSALAAAVLLLVCLNVANLMLARTAMRRRELSVRIALGASRGRIVGQLLVETLIIALLGGGLGLIVAAWAAQALAGVAAPAAAGAMLGVTLNLRVLGFAIAVSVVAGVVSGIWPAFAGRRGDVAAALSTEGRTVAGGRVLGRKVLVAAQIAVSFALLLGAGLFARTLWNLRDLDFGFDTRHLLSVRLDPTLTAYKPPQIAAFYDEVCARVAALPGVRSASFAAIPLLNRNNWDSGIVLDSGVHDDRSGPERNAVGPNYFHTVGLGLVAGREFTAADVASSLKVAVVNEAFAQKYFDGRAVGRRIGPGGPQASADVTIVGIVRNGRYAEVRENVTPIWYVPYRQLEPPGQSDTAVRISHGLLTVHVRTEADPRTAASAVRQAIAAVDKRVVVIDMRTMPQQISDQLALERLLAGLAAGFAAIAIALAALGLYGVTAYDTTARTREIGIRVALGATPLGIMGLILRQTATLTALGLAAGLVSAVAGIGYVRSLLFGLQPTDPIVVVSAAIVVVTFTTIAAVVPARRATRIDPITALN